MSDQTTDPVPCVNSVWRARDGRRVRVVEIVRTSLVPGGWWVKLDVLSPYRPRQRRSTTAGAAAFTSGFYAKEADFG